MTGKHPLTHVAFSLFLLAASGACGGSEAPTGPSTSSPDPTPSPTGSPTPTASPNPTTTPTTTPTTPPAPADQVVRFAALGDTGKGNQGQRDVAAAIAAKCQKDGCDFVQLLGDNIYDSGASSPQDQQFTDKFEQPYAPVSQPFYVVLGNHDYGGNGAGSEFANGKNEIDYTKISQKWKLPAAYYKHTQKHVEFFALDTNMQMYSQDAQQKTDVKGWIGASTATWKIAIGHHPYKSNGPHGNAGNYDNLPFVPISNGAGVKSFLDDVVCGKVDLYLSGHDHSRQWLVDKCSGTELMVSGAGASTTEIKGSNPAHFQNDKLGFHYFVINGRKLTAEFIDAQGTVEYTRTISK